MNEECLICKAPLEYLETDILMECAVCHKKENSRTRCIKGHYVCDECHTAGIDQIFAVCLNDTSTDPIKILEQMMSLDFCHMHGPEHHVMVGAALLTAYKNAGGRGTAFARCGNGDKKAFIVSSNLKTLYTVSKNQLAIIGTTKINV